MDHLHMFRLVVAVSIVGLAMAIIFTLNDSAYDHFREVWNGALDVVDRALGRAIERVDKW